MSDRTGTQKAALWIGVVFLLGAMLGGMLGYVFAHRSYAAGRAPNSESARRAQKVEELTREAHLTADQRKRLDEILIDVQGQMKAIHQQSEPQVEEVRKKARERIRAILTEEQKPEFEAFIRRLDEERKRNSQ